MIPSWDRSPKALSHGPMAPARSCSQSGWNWRSWWFRRHGFHKMNATAREIGMRLHEIWTYVYANFYYIVLMWFSYDSQLLTFIFFRAQHGLVNFSPGSQQWHARNCHTSMTFPCPFGISQQSWWGWGGRRATSASLPGYHRASAT